MGKALLLVVLQPMLLGDILTVFNPLLGCFVWDARLSDSRAAWEAQRICHSSRNSDVGDHVDG